MSTKNYKRLSLEERVIIQTLLEEKKSKSFIAQKLKRSRSTITREINKWASRPHEMYKAQLAHFCALDDYLNKRNKDKINSNPRLKFYVYKGLLNHWSPEQISGRIKRDFPKDLSMRISYEAIYSHIYKHPQARLNRKLIKLLPYQKTRRRRPNTYSKRGVKIKDQLSIEQRPEHINNRSEIGHWEGDLVIGKNQKSAIGTLVERQTRYACITKLNNRKSSTVTRAFIKTFKALNPNLLKSMTYDNGMEMAFHKNIKKQTGMDIYFAHPYASWERGTNENTNGLIRRFLPKKTDFNNVSEQQLFDIQNSLNNRPRKVLGYKTPNEVLNEKLNHIFLSESASQKKEIHRKKFINCFTQ